MLPPTHVTIIRTPKKETRKESQIYLNNRPVHLKL